MTDRPPSPQTPTTTSPLSTDAADDGRVLATTGQLADAIEETLGRRLDEEALEKLLLELDRGEYVEWVTVTRSGEYVWDLSESPDRIAEAVADALVACFRSWFRG